MDIEELRSIIREARKEFLDGKMSLTDEKVSLVHITQILTYVDLSIESYRGLVETYKEEVEKMLSCKEPSEDLSSIGITKIVDGKTLPRNSLVVQAAMGLGIEVCETFRDPKNVAVLDLSYALDSLRIPNEVRVVDGDVKIYVKGRRIRTVMVGIAQPEKAYGRSGEEIVKLRSYIPRFLSGSIGRKLLPIIVDLGLNETVKNIPIIYIPIGILSILAFYKQNVPAVSIYAPVYKNIQNLIA